MMELNNGEMLTSEHIVKGSTQAHFEGEWVVLYASYLHEKYKKPYFQIFKATAGFGCDPNKMGTKVFGKFLDGESGGLRRNDVIGILKPELVEEWKVNEMFKEAEKRVG